MNRRSWLKQRRPVWQQYENLLLRLEHGSRVRRESLESTQFAALFRELAHDLALVRSRGWGESLEKYLNQQVARGHSRLYAAGPARAGRVLQFLGRDFPRLFRRQIGWMALAALLFYGSLGISWAVVQHSPELASRILPPEQLETYEQMYSRPLVADGEDAGFQESRAGMAGFYIRNNVGIALECFARGFLFGVLTVYTLLQNGIIIGATTGYLLALGHGERFLGFVVSHGSFELTAICIAGGAGLLLGDSLIHPAGRTRLESLRHRGLEAVQLAAGAAALLVVAALIEAFWSPAPISQVVKYSGAGVLWVVIALYLGLAGAGHAD